MKTFALLKILSFTILIVGVSACSKSQEADPASAAPSGPVQTFPIQNVKLKNCHFQNPAPVYAFNSAIPPNPIQCEEGVAKSVQLLSPNPLPTGLEFVKATLSLSGTATEKVAQITYQFYIENEAGYVTIPIQITVR